MAASSIQNTNSIPGTIAEARRVAPLLGGSIREKADLTLAEVGRHVGVSAQTVWNWERGLCKPTGDPAVAYLDLLRELSRLAAPVPA